MKLPSLFKIPKHKRFSLKTIYFDAEKREDAPKKLFIRNAKNKNIQSTKSVFLIRVLLIFVLASLFYYLLT